MSTMDENATKKWIDEVAPGNTGLPWIGETFAVVTDGVHGFHIKRFEQFGEWFKTRIFGNDMIYCSDPQVTSWMLRQGGTLLETAVAPSAAKLFGPDSLLMVHKEVHTAHRKLLMNLFGPKMMKNLSPQVLQCAQRNLDAWCSSPNGVVANMSQAMQKFTFQVVLHSVVGVSNLTTKEEEEVLNDLRLYSQGLLSLQIDLPFTTFGKAMRARKRLVQFFDTKVETMLVAAEEEKYLCTDDNSFDTVIQHLAFIVDDNHNGFSRQSLVDNCIALMFAGMDTTSSTLTAALASLANRADIREKIRDETNHIFENTVTDADRSQLLLTENLPYLDAFIDEVMHYFPAVAGVARIALKDFEIPGTCYKVKKGQRIGISIVGSNSAPNQKTQLSMSSEMLVNLLDPEKRLATDYKLEKGEGHIPFGGGQRLCIGKRLAKLELRTMLALLVNKVDCKLLSTNSMPEFGGFHGLTLSPNEDLVVQITSKATNA